MGELEIILDRRRERSTTIFSSFLLSTSLPAIILAGVPASTGIVP